MRTFESINKAYNEVFQPGKLSIGMVVPIENYPHSSIPSLQAHLERVQLAERLGFKAIWLRDIPLHVPSFGDAGQTFDPFTYLGFLAGQTSQIALGIASIALPLHHPVHVAKSAATIDQLSGGRFLLGIASGDRFAEYPAMGIEFEKRGELFREAYDYLRSAADSFPIQEANHFGGFNGQVDVLPKPTGHKIPLLVTGHSRQSLEWIAQNGDGWMYYPRNLQQQQRTVEQWRSLVAQQASFDKPFMQSLYIDLHPNDDYLPQPIHLGFRIGIKPLIEFLEYSQQIGVNHIALNLRFNTSTMESALEKLAHEVLVHFHKH